jgi:hypothetical protein
MRLSQLVRTRNQLSEHNADRRVQREFMVNANYSMQQVLSSPDIRIKHEDGQTRLLRDVETYLDRWHSSIEKIVADMDEEIGRRSQAYMSESETLYFRSKAEREILPITCDIEDRKYIKERCALYNDWRLPGVIFGATDLYITQSLTALDPLYIVDVDYERVNNIVKKFPEKYQHRVRQYINKKQNQLAKLPVNQIGFIASYNYLNYLPWSQIRNILDNAFLILRAGGTLAFTYNDCDKHHGVLWFESQGTSSFVTGTMIRSYALSRGWTISNDWTDGVNLHWLELTKPGNLVATKAGQTLARIHADPASVRKFKEMQVANERRALERQKELEKVYTELETKQREDSERKAKEDYENLILRALRCNISDPRAYDPKKLLQIVERREIVAKKNKHPLPQR